MTAKSPRKRRSGYNGPIKKVSWAVRFAAALLAGVTLSAARATADTPVPYPGSAQTAYEILESKANAVEQLNHETGWAYIISGGVALGVSIPAYYLSTDIFAEAVYSVGQTLGVAAIGYGTYLVLIDDDYSRFRHIIDETPALPRSRKEALSREFLTENAVRARNVRRIRVITHGLTAMLNFLSAATTNQTQLRTALLFVGGINTLAALSFGLTLSEEEKVALPYRSGRTPVSVDFVVGPMVGLALHF